MRKTLAVLLVLCAVDVAQSSPISAPRSETPAYVRHFFVGHNAQFQPASFENVLPEETKAKLRAIHNNLGLTFEERKQQVSDVFDSLPPTVLQRLPPPPALLKLPSDFQQRFHAIHRDVSLKWSQQMDRLRRMVEELPSEQRQLVVPQRPRHNTVPPPGFEKVLPKSIYAQLLKVHKAQISDSERRDAVDMILRNVPFRTLQRLPLPSIFIALPVEYKVELQQLIHDFTTPWRIRHQRVRQFIEALPEEVKVLMTPTTEQHLPAEKSA